MNKLIPFLLFITLISCAQKTSFDKIALEETFTTIDEKQISFKNILAKHKNKTILIDIWASWCGDCIKDMPEMSQLQKDQPDVIFLKLSVDRNVKQWKKGIARFKVTGEHYLIHKGWKNSDFCKSINTNWIPRYLIVGKDGKIKMYKATKITSKKILRKIKSDK